MKIIYIFTSPSLKGSSVQTKVLNQIKYLNKAGADCRGAFFSTEVKEITTFNEFVDLIPVPKCNWKYFRKIGQRRILDMILLEYIKGRYNNTDIFYLRYPLASKGLYTIAKKFGGKIVTEHQSKEIQEISLDTQNNSFGIRPSHLLSWIQYKQLPLYLEKKYGYLIRNRIKATVSVTNEIGHFQKKAGSRKSIIVSNGIDVKSYPVRNVENISKSTTFKILYLKGGSSDVPWSGLERLINSINSNQKRKNIFELIIAGKPEEKFESYSFIKQLGYVKEPELTKLINSVHLGLNHLALYKIGLSESSNIKAREYFSRGLPFINASFDMDIEKNNFVLQVTNDNTIINLTNIEMFIKEIYSDRSHAFKMRKYAEAYLDYEVKMKKLYSELIRINYAI